MSALRCTLDRLADLLRRDRKIIYRACINARIAPYVTPLLDKIVADDEDGDTIRDALIPWKRAERPSIAIYCGDVSTCRIDGPWQVADGHLFPLGGLIVTRGITAHLNPVEAQALYKRMQRAIEDTTRAWVHEHNLYSLGHGPAEIDREVADPAAKAMIMAWAFRHRESDALPNADPNNPHDCSTDESDDAICALCRKGLGHA